MLSVVRRPLIIAHRGASQVAPENTLTAFQTALALGADGVELDVRLSADGVPVVIHDATVDATTDGSGPVSGLTLGELKDLDAGCRFDRAFSGEQIPTLAEVLDTWPAEAVLNIELKGFQVSERGLEIAVVELLRKYRWEKHAVVSSFNPLALHRVRELSARVPIALLYAHRSLLRLRLSGLLVQGTLAALHPHYAVVDPRHVTQAHARGARVNVWTVDDPIEMRRLVHLNVDGIITNVPRVMQDVLGRESRSIERPLSREVDPSMT